MHRDTLIDAKLAPGSNVEDGVEIGLCAGDDAGGASAAAKSVLVQVLLPKPVSVRVLAPTLALVLVSVLSCCE